MAGVHPEIVIIVSKCGPSEEIMQLTTVSLQEVACAVPSDSGFEGFDEDSSFLEDDSFEALCIIDTFSAAASMAEDPVVLAAAPSLRRLIRSARPSPGMLPQTGSIESARQLARGPEIERGVIGEPPTPASPHMRTRWILRSFARP